MAPLVLAHPVLLLIHQHLLHPTKNNNKTLKHVSRVHFYKVVARKLCCQQKFQVRRLKGGEQLLQADMFKHVSNPDLLTNSLSHYLLATGMHVQTHLQP